MSTQQQTPTPLVSPFSARDTPWVPPAVDFPVAVSSSTPNTPLHGPWDNYPKPTGPDFSKGNILVQSPAPNTPAPDFSKGNVLAGPWDNYPKPTGPAFDPTATPVATNSQSPFNPADQPWTPPLGDRPVSTNPIDAARNSVGNIVSGIGKLGGVVDQAIFRHTSPAWAKALGATGDLQNGVDQSVVNAGNAISGPRQYTPAPIHQLGDDVAGGHPLDALRDASGIVAGAIPYAATAMIPGAGPALLGAAGAGDTMAAREQAKGTTSPSLGDVAAGAASGVLNAAGGGVAHGLTSSVVTPTLERLLGKSLAGKLAARTAMSSVAGGTLGASNNIAGTADTGTMSASGVGNAAVEGAGAGGLAAAAGAAPGAARSGLSLAGDGITARAQGPITAARAASIARIVPDLDRFADPSNNIRPTAPMAQKVAGYSKALTSQTLALGNEIATRPGMPDSALAGIIRPLVSAAASHNNAVPVDLLQQFNALPLDEPTRTTFNNAISDLDTLSQGKLLSNQSGPFASIGSKVAGTATTLALLSHSPTEALANVIAGHAAENKIGGAVGNVVDKVMGTSKPVMQAQARAAVRQALASGQPIGPSSLDATASATAALRDDNAAASDSQAAQNTQSLMRPTVAALSQFGPSHPVGKAALQQLQAHGASELAAPAIAQFEANQPIAQAKADVKNQAAADAQNEAAAQVRRRADAAAALAPLATAQGKIDTATTRNQTTLDAADLRPQTAAPTGLTAVNAAVNQVGRQAAAVRAIGGEVVPRGDVPQEATGESHSGSNAAEAPMGQPAGRPLSESPGASSESPRTYTEHLIGRAGDEHGVQLTPADIQAALTQATASGHLTPFDYQRVSGNLDTKLGSGEDFHTANIILRHAVGAKAAAGVPVRGVKGAVGAGDSPTIYSPTRYANAVATHQRHLNDVAAQADAAGDQELGDLARALRVTKDVTTRRVLRDTVTNARMGRGDILGASRVKILLSDGLIDSASKTSG